MAHSLILFGSLLYTAGTVSLKTLEHVTVRTGGTVTIPCLYDDHYKLETKYWCKGSNWNWCQIQTCTDTRGKWPITDDPTQNIFTVQLNNLKSSDSGYYWCAVEIHYGPDDGYYLYLDVQSVPDLSVVNRSVIGDEGGDISVQCLYSSGYKNEHKQWCRYKDQSCYTVGRTNTSQNSSVQITDDERESFTVMMTGLMKSDSGWYWCSVGNLQVPVQLIVQDDKKNENTTRNDQDSHNGNSNLNTVLLPLWIAGPVLLLLMVVVLIWRIERKHNKTLNTQELLASSQKESTVWYDTVIFKKRKVHNQQNQFCPADQGDEVTYSDVKLL